MGGAQLIRDNTPAICRMLGKEIHCDDEMQDINIQVALSTVEEAAAAMSSEAMSGQVLPTAVLGAYPLVINEPHGVVFGMAPWNAPLILGLRAVCAPLAAGNTVVFQVLPSKCRSPPLSCPWARPLGPAGLYVDVQIGGWLLTAARAL